MRSRRFILAVIALAGAAAVIPSSPASAAGAPAFVTGPGNGESPDVRVFDNTGALVTSFTAGAAKAGARVAAGDVNGDGSPEIVVATGPGVPSQVVVQSLNGVFNGSFVPYGGFRGGVNVAAGDVDGDGRAEIVTAADTGGGPHVIVWEFASFGLRQRTSWYAYDPGFPGGVRVAVSNGLGRGQVVTATGPGGGPHVRLWDISGSGVRDGGGWFAYAPTWTGGVNVSAGLVDGTRSVVTGVGPGGGPHVRVFSTSGVVRSEFFAYAPGFGGGVNVAVSGTQGPGAIVVGPASWAGPHVKAVTSSGATVLELFAYAANPINGVNVATISGGTSSSTNQNNANQNGSNTSF
ncbi:MAG: VCBS repeat-containing protein [Acidimicrobiales bacterium]|nr:VCBS repeat-containing protein [Acidimicrobiales bacterium]